MFSALFHLEPSGCSWPALPSFRAEAALLSSLETFLGERPLVRSFLQRGKLCYSSDWPDFLDRLSTDNYLGYTHRRYLYDQFEG